MSKEKPSAFWNVATGLTTLSTVALGIGYAVESSRCPAPDVVPVTKGDATRIELKGPPECDYKVDINGIKTDLASQLGIPFTSDTMQADASELPDYTVTSGFAPVEFSTPQGTMLMAVPPNMLVEAIENNVVKDPKTKKTKSILPFGISAILSAISVNMTAFNRKKNVRYSSNKKDVIKNTYTQDDLRKLEKMLSDTDDLHSLDVSEIGYIPYPLWTELDRGWKIDGQGRLEYFTLGALMRDVTVNRRLKPEIRTRIEKEFKEIEDWHKKILDLVEGKRGGVLKLTGDDAKLANDTIIEAKEGWADISTRNVARVILRRIVTNKIDSIKNQGLGAELRGIRMEINAEHRKAAENYSQANVFSSFVESLNTRFKPEKRQSKGNNHITIDGETGKIIDK